MVTPKYMKPLFQTLRKIILSLLFVSVTGMVSAQQQRVVFPSASMTIKSVFSEIEKQTDIMFIVHSNSLDMAAGLMLPEGEAAVSDILELILDGTDKTWVVDGRYIIIPVDKPAEQIKTGTVTGKIVGHTGDDPLEGVTVEIVGTGIRVKTGRDGSFVAYDVPAGDHVIKIVDASGHERYTEIAVAEARQTSFKMAFDNSDPDLQDEDNYSEEIVSVDINPIKRVDEYDKKDTLQVIMPAAGTYTMVSLEEKTTRSYQPKTAVKTNLLYLATTTPNIGMEFYLANRWSFNAHIGYNAWKFGGDRGFLHWVVQPEARYWFCNVFERHFIGVHGIYGKYNIQDVKMPFTDTFVGHRYKGFAYGAGIAWGYHLPFGKRWGVEFSVGAGYVYMEYDKYRCGSCDEFEGRRFKHYFGPTKASVSMVFLIK